MRKEELDIRYWEEEGIFFLSVTTGLEEMACLWGDHGMSAVVSNTSYLCLSLTRMPSLKCPVLQNARCCKMPGSVLHIV